MTTIVYKGGIIAADTRRTMTSTIEALKCSDCGEPRRVVSDTSTKLYSGPQGMFRGEPVWVFGGAGNVNLIHRARDLILKGEDIETIYASSFKLNGKKFNDFFSLLTNRITSFGWKTLKLMSPNTLNLKQLRLAQVEAQPYCAQRNLILMQRTLFVQPLFRITLPAAR
jgi:hypothetical protein